MADGGHGLLIELNLEFQRLRRKVIRMRCVVRLQKSQTDQNTLKGNQ